MSIIDSVLSLIQESKLTLSDGATLIKGALKTVEAGADGTKDGILETMVALEPAVLPVLEKVADLLMPGAGAGVAVVAFMMTHAHKMTQDETNAWMDQTSRTGGL